MAAMHAMHLLPCATSMYSIRSFNFTDTDAVRYLYASKMPGDSLHHDACGAGFLADREGRPGPHSLPRALVALSRMEHRGGVGGDGETGDGAGVLTQVPWSLLLPEL